jgi:hypothetical protein
MVEAEFPGLPNARWVALRLLEGDPMLEEAIRNHTLGDLTRGASAQPVGEVIPLEAAA